MGSSIKINSISIDLAAAANEIDMVKCDHFSIRGFVAGTRERDQRKCWPFSEESVSLVDQHSYSLPSLFVPKFRWWHCMSCIRDIDSDGTKDCGLHTNSRTIRNSSVIPIKSKLTSLTIIDQKKERKIDIAGNAVEENEGVNYERSQKDDQTATTFLKKVHSRSLDASTVRSKSRKLASPEQVGKRSKDKVNKSSINISSSKEKQNLDQAVTTFGSSEIAGVVEDTPPKAIKNRKGIRVPMECDNGSPESINLAMSGLQRRKTRKVRLLSELLGKANTKTSGSSNVRKEESASKRESVRGRKRKLLPENNYVSRKLSTIGASSENGYKSCDSDQGDSESTDSGFDRDPIKGKQKNRRFQVVDEFVPSLPCETSQEGINENDADPSKRSTHVHCIVTGKNPVHCPPSTQRTERKLGLAKKKIKKPIIDHGKSTLISFSTGLDEGNQDKLQTGPSSNAISQTTRDLLNEKKVGSLFDNHLASEGYIRKYISQLNDKPVISLHSQDNNHLRSRDVEANCFRDFSSSSKANRGEWLRSGVDVVDFTSNRNNTNRLSFPNFKLKHTPPTDVTDPSCVLRKDASVADRKGKTIMVQEHHGEPKSLSHNRKENTPDEQNDDIPMEIVELMAKNQYERCLPDKEEDINNKQPSHETAHKSKNALLIDLNETYDNGISLEDNNTSKPPKPCGSNARMEERFPIEKQQNSLDFFPISQPYVPSPFGIFPPTQENRVSSIGFSGHNCQWLGNLPTLANQNPSPSSFRVLRACNTCQSVPHQYGEDSHPIWSSSMIPPQGHRKPVSFNIDQSTKLGTLSQASSNENTWNLNFVSANGKHKCGSNSELSFGCKHAAGVSTSRSVDTFSNESSIPALHLLSLMDPRLRSTTPVDQHANAKFTKRHFPPVNQSKEFIELQTGDSSKTVYSTKQLPFDFYNKRFELENSQKSFPIIPPLGTSSFSFQNAQGPWSRHQEKKIKRKDTFAPVHNSHDKSVFASSSDQGKFQLLGASNSMMLPLKFHMTDKEKRLKRKAESCSNAAVWPLKNGSGLIVCSVNRNPADFTIPEPANVYMLTGDDLKVRKRTTIKRKPSLCKQDAMKLAKKPVCPATENA